MYPSTALPHVVIVPGIVKSAPDVTARPGDSLTHFYDWPVLLSSAERPDRVSSNRRAALITVLLALAVLSATFSTGSVGGGLALVVVLALVVTILAVGTAAGYEAVGSIRLLLLSPLALAVLTWLALFVLRPIELYVAPGDATYGLAQLGFGDDDLVRTVALGALGCATWTIGYLLALGRLRLGPVRAGETTFAGVGATAALAVGTALWVLLFVRQGGPSALVESAVSIRFNQRASFYGYIGVWLLQGTVLYAFAVMLQTGRLAAKRVVLVGIPLAVAASVALQLRMLSVFFLLGLGAIYVGLREMSRRRIALAAGFLVAAVLGFAFAQQVRVYTYHESLPEATRLAAKTPVSQMFVSDLGTFDHFVAMEQLVPGSIEYLDGQSLVEIPLAMIPRTLWPEKPLGIDHEVTSYLYPGSAAGTPISMQGEFYWNGGIALVAFGSLLVGAFFGIAARFGLRLAPTDPRFVVYAALWPFTHAIVTRGFATMIENAVFALVGVTLALVAAGVFRPLDVLRRPAAVIKTSWLLAREALPTRSVRGHRAP